MNSLEIEQSPRLVVLHEQSFSNGRNSGGLKLLTSHEPFISAVLDFITNGDGKRHRFGSIAVPRKWHNGNSAKSRIVRYTSRIPFSSELLNELRTAQWLVVSNGRYFSTVSRDRLVRILADMDVNLVAVDVDPALAYYGESVSRTSRGDVAGFRRSYQDSAIPVEMPADWPMHLIISSSAARAIAASGGLHVKFSEFLEWAQSRGFISASVKIGGAVMDLEKESDLLAVIRRIAAVGNGKGSGSLWTSEPTGINMKDCVIDPGARLFGRVIYGSGLRVGCGAVISGPTMLGDNVKIGAGAVVRNSVIAPGLSIPPGAIIENRVIENQRQIFENKSDAAAIFHYAADNKFSAADNHAGSRFRIWPRFSYARFFKRLFDIAISLIVLILFMPFAPFVVLAVKFSSPGPVLFKDRRQGLHGRYFNCLKFRTMVSDASRLQEHLRKHNEVGGLHFSIKDDPRINAVGRFLRETFIDEVPQFINVLLGQMSLVGPRPSPEAENTQCPRWRDARLSVRPGITGLWQVRRTRAWGRDFQEWIKYDVKYVTKLSFKMDLLICWLTFLKIARGFTKQFTK
ncbi:MAG: sugar transferase [Phycisphaerae bacterium]|jgi:lipopolysaccharide/colanic/teichoic acid biosynthesis glycosyltransferase